MGRRCGSRGLCRRLTGSASSGALATLHWRRCGWASRASRGPPAAPRSDSHGECVCGGEDPAARACRQTHKALRVTRPVSPQARGSPARLAHPANTGTTFPPVPGVPSSRFTLWREGHAPDPVGWPGQEQSRCCGPAVPSKGRWVRAEADKTCGNPAARPSTLAAGSLQGCWGPRGRASPHNYQLGPKPHHGAPFPSLPGPKEHPPSAEGTCIPQTTASWTV